MGGTKFTAVWSVALPIALLIALPVALLVALPIGCSSAPPKPSAQSIAPDTGPAPVASPVPDAGPVSRGPSPPATRIAVAPTRRIIAMGDVHGDLRATRDALMLAGVLDGNDQWVGGETIVVQVGDQLDRGDDERAILDLFERLAEQALAAGGGFYALLGNHETMNVSFDFRYVTAGGWRDFESVPVDADDPHAARHATHQRGRVSAFRPGGRYARILAGHNMVLVVGDTMFVHGGILPKHVTYGLERMNQEVQAWMRGEAMRPPFVAESDGPVWSRHFSDAPDGMDCALLQETLWASNTTRMVVAHTVQQTGITAACSDQVWRVDVGLARYYGGLPSVLEIVGDRVTTLN